MSKVKTFVSVLICITLFQQFQHAISFASSGKSENIDLSFFNIKDLNLSHYNGRGNESAIFYEDMDAKVFAKFKETQRQEVLYALASQKFYEEKLQKPADVDERYGPLLVKLFREYLANERLTINMTAHEIMSHRTNSNNPIFDLIREKMVKKIGAKEDVLLFRASGIFARMGIFIYLDLVRLMHEKDLSQIPNIGKPTAKKVESEIRERFGKKFYFYRPPLSLKLLSSQVTDLVDFTPKIAEKLANLNITTALDFRDLITGETNDEDGKSKLLSLTEFSAEEKEELAMKALGLKLVLPFEIPEDLLNFLPNEFCAMKMSLDSKVIQKVRIDLSALSL